MAHEWEPDEEITKASELIGKGLGAVCEHGSLARSCDRCDDARELAALRAENERLAGLVSASMDRADARLLEVTDEYERTTAALRAEVADLKDRYAARGEYLQAVQRDKDALRAEVERLGKDYGNACATVSRMHAAAVGSSRNPVVGLVEDVAAIRARAEKAEELLTRAEAALRKIIAGVEADERHHYPPALVQVNAPLALIQVELATRKATTVALLSDLAQRREPKEE